MGSAKSLQSLVRLSSTGANWVAIVVTQYQWTIDDTAIMPLYDPAQVRDTTSRYYTFVTLTPDELRAGIRHAKGLGLKVLLKPHVDLLRGNKPLGAHWRGEIGSNFNGSQWGEWFASYERMLLPYAAMAQAEGVDMLSVHCELAVPSLQEARWRGLVGRVRPVFGGQLTAAAIKGWEFRCTWWDVLDVVGVDAYYPIPGDTLPELVNGWQQYVAIAERLHTQYGKNVTYTEVGYCSGRCSRTHTPGQGDYDRQALRFQAVFEAFRGKGWFLGAFWWNWDTDPGAFRRDDCLTPQSKPAEDVLRTYYRATQPEPKPPGFPAQCIGDGKCTC
jgi:hypothetical protein